jgi:hypothetical protein
MGVSHYIESGMPRRIASKKGCHGVMLIELRMIYLGQVVWVAALDTHKHGHLLVRCTWFDNIFYMKIIWRLYESYMKIIWRLYEDYMKIIWILYEDYMKIMWILKYGDNMGMLLLIIWHHTSFGASSCWPIAKNVLETMGLMSCHHAQEWKLGNEHITGLARTWYLYSYIYIYM